MDDAQETRLNSLLDLLPHSSQLRRALWLPPLLALLLYLPALRGGLVWDDPLFLRHPLYRPPIDWARALGSPFVLSPNYFRPLAVASFLLIGATPWLNHLVNTLLHALNTALVTSLIPRLAVARDATHRRFSPLWLAGVLYAAYPALTEGAAFISGRFDLLVTTFLLLALVADRSLRRGNLFRAMSLSPAAISPGQRAAGRGRDRVPGQRSGGRRLSAVYTRPWR